MSTRCSIWIQEQDGTSKVYYHHYDGYMSGVGEALYAIPKAKRTNLKNVVRGLEKRFGRKYILNNYTDNAEIDLGVSALEFCGENTNPKNEPLDIEWRYRILKDGNLEVDAIAPSETFKIANRKHFDFLVNHTEKDL